MVLGIVIKTCSYKLVYVANICAGSSTMYLAMQLCWVYRAQILNQATGTTYGIN